MLWIGISKLWLQKFVHYALKNPGFLAIGKIARKIQPHPKSEKISQFTWVRLLSGNKDRILACAKCIKAMAK